MEAVLGEKEVLCEIEVQGPSDGGWASAVRQSEPCPRVRAQMVNGELVPQPTSDENIFIPAGGSATVPLNHEVVRRYQCCIHPWMRLTISPKDQHHSEVH
jgi:hypothetical protein